MAAAHVASPAPAVASEWLHGWDPTPHIVSVWADGDGRADVWRRDPSSGRLTHERDRFRPWLLLDRLDDLAHLGAALQPEDSSGGTVTWRELEGEGELRFRVSAADLRTLRTAVLTGARTRLGRDLATLRDLGAGSVLSLPPDEQYLVASGRTYFKDLPFDGLRRLQFDLETTGLHPATDRVFMIAVRDPDGASHVLEAREISDQGEAALIEDLMALVRRADPDVIENHNLHGFDLPFLDRRARHLGIALQLGRLAGGALRPRAARRGADPGGDPRGPKVRLVAPGRELIDTLDAVWRYDFATRELPGHGLKAVARHLGIARPDRELIRGDQIFATWRRDPDRVRRYATHDVEEVADLARLLGGAAFALARMAPRRYERLADAGAATGVIDPLLVRAYLRAGAALPAHQPGRDTPHSGAALHLFATGVAHHVVKADVASLYPSLMRVYRIGPARDRLGVLLAIVDQLVEQRLAAKAAGRAAAAGSAERYTHEATSAAMKLVVNSAYGYLAAGGGLTRFADVDAANEVTRRGREMLGLVCAALGDRGVTLLEADTDGVYFASPPGWSEADERRVVAEVAALLPPLVHLEFEGRYQAMLSHEPKNYALLGYDGSLLLKGVAFRSSRFEPFGQAFLRRAIGALLAGDVAAVRQAWEETLDALRGRRLSTHDVSSRVRLTKSRERYDATRVVRREVAYEALMAADRDWRSGERVRVYRTAGGGASLAAAHDDARRDYDVAYYARLLRTTFASRLARAFRADDFVALFEDPDQPSLFPLDPEAIAPVLTPAGDSSA